MGQIGSPLKVVQVPRPEVAPTYDPPERMPEAEPQPIAVPATTPAPERVKVPV